MAAHFIVFGFVLVPFIAGIVITAMRSARLPACHHELVELGKAGAGSVYTCRLCGATLYDTAATKPIPLLWNWIFALAFLGMSSSVFIGEAFPALHDGRLHNSPVSRGDSPTIYWGFVVVFVGFSVITLAVSLWQFWSAYQKLRRKEVSQPPAPVRPIIDHKCL